MDILFGNTKITLSEEDKQRLIKFTNNHHTPTNTVFIAQDYDGSVFVYDEEPDYDEPHNCWTSVGNLEIISNCDDAHLEGWRSRCVEVSLMLINNNYTFS